MWQTRMGVPGPIRRHLVVRHPVIRPALPPVQTHGRTVGAVVL
jgi:hypothetical protein